MRLPEKQDRTGQQNMQLIRIWASAENAAEGRCYAKC